MGTERLHLHQLPGQRCRILDTRGGSAVLAAPPCPAWGGGGDSDLLQHTVDQGGGRGRAAGGTIPRASG